MVKYHLNNCLTDCVKDSFRFQNLTDEEHIILYDEICNATLQGIHEKLVLRVSNNTKVDNNTNSLLIWVLGITDQKPNGYISIKNEGSYPDIDTDFSKLNRDKVIDYTKDKYGHDRVCQVVTFGTLGAKGSIRSSARALGYTVAEGDFIAKMIANEPDITIDISIANNPALKEIWDKQTEPYFHILTMAKKLEGLPNSSGTHASALIISDKPTWEYVPLMISKKEGGGITTQFEYKDCEANFLIKWDYLGLQTLDIIQETIKLVNDRHNKKIASSTIDVSDPNIYKLLNDGFVPFLFQFDGTAGTYIPRIKPETVDEVSDISAILRPGPMSMGMVEQYINAKFHNKKFNYNLTDQKLLDKVWEICSKSYGLMIYQESVISCFSEIAGFNEIEADNARRIMGKKLPDEMQKLLTTFLSGGILKGYTEEGLIELFNQIAGFSAYGFNKSHSISYAYITCQCAWLSYYYPLEFFSTILSITYSNTDDVRKAITALKERNITISPPNINKSKSGFSIVDDTIVFGMSAIKGVGKALTDKLIKNKPKGGYLSFGHFVTRNIDSLNKKILESYIKAGVFVDFGYSKNTLLDSVDNILELISELKANKKPTTIDVLDIDFAYFIEACLIKYSDKPDSVYYEVDAIGMYISKHPLDDYVVDTKVLSTIDMIKEYDEDESEFRCSTVGVVTNISIRKTKSKQNMCDFLLTDKNSSIKVVVFPTVYGKFTNELEEGRIAFMSGFVKYDNDERVLYPREIAQYSNKAVGLMRKLSSNVVIPKKTDDEIIIHSVGKLKFKLEKKNV